MEFIKQLREKLADPLPGKDAQNLMIPMLASGTRPKFKEKKAPRQGAVMLLLYEQAGILHFPLIQRPTYDGVHSGQVALPGGKRDPEDPDLQFTALRETHEEIGIPSEEIEVLGNLSEILVAASNHMILPVVGVHHGVPEFVPDNHEVAEVIEVPLDVLLDKRMRKKKEILTDFGFSLISPYFDIHSKVVWGATAMMLSEFSEIIKTIRQQ